MTQQHGETAFELAPDLSPGIHSPVSSEDRPFFVVDAFAAGPFTGNPAAIVLLDRLPEDAWLLAVARESGTPATAFVWRDGGLQLRWFTPTTEVDLCGHGTLAAAHVLWSEGALQADEPARFSTRGGALTARRRGTWIELDFPTMPAEGAKAPRELVEALGVMPRWVGRSEQDFLVLLESEQAVRYLRPDIPRLLRIPGRGVIVTAPASTAGFDFVSRFFAPKVGVDEDHVCGSAHCTLGPFWTSQLSKRTTLACQVSPRGGVVRVSTNGSRVGIGGQAVTVIRGRLSPGD